MTKEEINGILANYKKVASNSGSLVVDVFYNESTNDIKRIATRDYDYSDCSRDIDELYYLPIDEVARIKYLHSRGVILEGDVVKVVKGRTLPVNSQKKVKAIKPYYDKYHRWICDYLYFTDGTRIKKDNCVLI